MNGGLVRLREVRDSLTPSEKRIADYVLRQPEKLINLSVAQLAQLSGGSQAAIIRLCKSLGLKGFHELKIKVLGDLYDGEQAGYQEILPKDSIASIINTVSNNNMMSIRDTIKILDNKMVEKAVRAIFQADRIFFFGLGASSLIGLDAQHKFMRINKTCFSFTDPHMQLTSAVTLTKNDVAVGISYSGETAHVVSCLQYANDNGAATISITKYGNTTVSQHADFPLFISSTENEIRSGAMSSRITQLNVIDILYLGVASLDYEKSRFYLEKSREAVAKHAGR
ncbi:MAG TPA: MurR/RpiR family transcriptional regulator [Bacilli bacterium]